MILEALLLLLALCGLGLSLYFTLLYYRIVRPSGSASTVLCRLSRSACERVVWTSYGRLCVLPNSVFGLAFYVLVTTLAVSLLRPAGATTAASPQYLQGLVSVLPAVLLPASLLGATISVGVGFYLVYALFIKLKAPCGLCLLVHALNVAIACLLACIKVAQ
jgi:uncharacterized membrane protein